MKFIVTGANKNTGARMTLEFEADSKAQAQRKAEGAGMYVHTAKPADESVGPPVRGKRKGKRGVVFLLIGIIVVVAVCYIMLKKLGGH